jgi:uncharacterized delta-60 repeat protein
LGNYQAHNSGKFLLARFTEDGRPDHSFADRGVLLTNLAEKPTGNALAIQSDGQLLVAGNSGMRNTRSWDFTLVRLHEDGRFDTAFGSGGIVTTDFLGATDSAIGVGVQSDGRIVACGNACTMRSGDECFVAVARYHRDGTLDPTFGVN